jgi:hypothetical protein
MDFDIISTHLARDDAADVLVNQVAAHECALGPAFGAARVEELHRLVVAEREQVSRQDALPSGLSAPNRGRRCLANHASDP